MCERAPAPSVTLTAAAAPLSGSHLGDQVAGIAGDGRNDLGGDDEMAGFETLLELTHAG